MTDEKKYKIFNDFSDDEANQLFNDIVQKLLDYDLNWVVDQVNEQIRYGKASIEKIQSYKEDTLQEEAVSEQPYRFVASGFAQYSVMKEYSPQQKLKILVESFDRITIEVVQFQEEVLSFLQEQTEYGVENPVISLYSEEEDLESFKLSQEDLIIPSEGWKSLEELIREMAEGEGKDYVE